MRRRLAAESGQALLVTVLFLGVLLGAVALTLDVGSWFRQQRQAQATADAAALAGAQALPTDPSQGIALAQQYADQNGGDVAPGGITITGTPDSPNDTVNVAVARPAPSFFASLFSIGTVTTHATASARAGVPEQVNGAAPIVVNKKHPLLSGPGCPCFGVETTLPLDKTGAPGAFGLVNLDPGSNNGVPPLSTWIQNGFDGYLPLGPYNSDPGAKFNGDDIRAALTARLNSELLFPVYDSLSGPGANATYDVIGWVAFHLDGFPVDQQGNSFDLRGYFTRVVWDGIQSDTDKDLPDFGVYSVSLVN